MLAFRSSFHQSLMSALRNQMTAIDDLGEKVDNVENKMGGLSVYYPGPKMFATYYLHISIISYTSGASLY